MCGRIYIERDEDAYGRMLNMLNKQQRESLAQGEVFPGQTALTVVHGDNSPKPMPALWGFKYGKRSVINCRAETAMQRPMFSRCMAESRCVVPARGFYEWDESKTRWIFTLPGDSVIYLGGLYRMTEDGIRFVIITSEANESMAEIHDRMPLILPKQSVRSWLSDTAFASEYLKMPKPLLERKIG